MKSWFAAILCLLAFQGASAKEGQSEVKFDQKINALINPAQQFRAPVISDVARACKSYTSTYANEDLCLSIRSRPEITKSCYYNTSSYDAEKICLSYRTSLESARACKRYTSSLQNEIICLSYRVKPSTARGCYAVTSTYRGEANCLITGYYTPGESYIPRPPTFPPQL